MDSLDLNLPKPSEVKSMEKSVKKLNKNLKEFLFNLDTVQCSSGNTGLVMLNMV